MYCEQSFKGRLGLERRSAVRALAALTDDLGFNSSTHVASQHPSVSSRIHHPLPASVGTRHIHVTQMYMQANTHIHKNFVEVLERISSLVTRVGELWLSAM